MEKTTTPAVPIAPLPRRLAWFAPWRWFSHWRPWKRWGLFVGLGLVGYAVLAVPAEIALSMWDAPPAVRLAIDAVFVPSQRLYLSSDVTAQIYFWEWDVLHRLFFEAMGVTVGPTIQSGSDDGRAHLIGRWPEDQ
jgi:hypothetical protein